MKEAIRKTNDSRGVVVWAIDPFEKETRPNRVLVRNLVQWASVSSLEVQPVYILAAPKESTAEFVRTGGIGRYIEAATEAAERYVRDLGMEGVRRPQVLVAKSNSREDEVRELLAWSEEADARCLMVSSHGRSGLERAVLGSFSENLLRHSQIPVLFLTHFRRANENEHGVKNVLFATDFTEDSLKAYRLFLQEAQRSGFHITLVHSVYYPAVAISADWQGQGSIPGDFFATQMKIARTQGARWLRLARTYGIPARLIVKNDGIGPHVIETLLSAAHDENCDWIAMASTSGRISSFILGSVAREVFRSNQYPVWVYGPKAVSGDVSAAVDGSVPSRSAGRR